MGVKEVEKIQKYLEWRDVGYEQLKIGYGALCNIVLWVVLWPNL
jgi:hypothetical protein